jgi:[ribosomal protein S18]-alanine N-acetyltransferase
VLKYLPFKEEHLDRIVEIENLSFPQPWSKGMFERELALPISNFFVAYLDETMIGYGGFWRVEDEAHLISLAVHPKYRSKGYCRQILDFLSAAMLKQGLKKILLEVRKNNQSAIGLYGSCGFKTVGLREKYYNNTDDAVLMEKQITEGVPQKP